MSRNTYFHGVISDERLAISGHDGPRVIVQHTPQQCSVLLQLAEMYQLHTIWVVPGSILSHADPQVFRDVDPEIWDIHYTELPTGPSRLNMMKSVTAFRHKGTWDEKRMITINFPEQSAWEWEEEDPLTLLLAILQLSRDLALPMNGHPGVMGRELMDWGVITDHKVLPNVDLGKLEMLRCGRDLAWKRAIAPGEGAYLHGYDKNSMYLSAAQGAGLGVGDPVHYQGETMKEPDVRKAGVWRIEASLVRPNVQKELVTLHSRRNVEGPKYPLVQFADKLPWPVSSSQEWVTNVTIKLLKEMGGPIKIYEGYEWENTKRALGAWAEEVWKWRQHYKGDKSAVGQLCYTSMKRIATASVGLLTSDKTPEKERRWFRPDWWSIIVETAKARMLYNIDNYGKAFRIWPAMVYYDALYYVSDSPDPDPRLLVREKELGGYKHKGAWRITDELREWLRGDVSAGGVVTHLGELEEVEYASPR